ncbi:MAG: uroporphyrinogen decarboxylase family protein [Bacteroidetes bacterium]|nr:uroporphyrinogen decarboxylase family protein [Bacteroidota bacterium]
MTSLERVLTTLGHKEPDRVPLFLLLTLHGAKELGLSIKDYFSKAKYVVEGQLTMQKKYQNDCFYTFFYAPLEVEAWGGEVIYVEDGPPNSGEPVIQSIEKILSLDAPIVKNSKCLHKVLEATSLIKATNEHVPIIGVVMSPFSLPVMQLGFDKYLELIYHYPIHFNRLMQLNKAFCIEWANAQLAAGATAICYFDPLSSPTMIEPSLVRKTGFTIANELFTQINGPTATHLASGHTLSVMDDLAGLGTSTVGVSSLEDLAELKKVANHRFTLLGNLNGIEMCRWSVSEAEQKVKEAIGKAAVGGGFILSDNHGEIPYQVKEEVLMAISEATREWGSYPIAQSLRNG